MVPIDFNPNNKSFEGMTSTHKTGAATTNNHDVTGNIPVLPSPLQTADKLVLSDAIKALQQATSNLQAEAMHEQRLTELKAQIDAGTLPIMSNDPHVRKAAAYQVADKLVEFERQLAEALIDDEG